MNMLFSSTSKQHIYPTPFTLKIIWSQTVTKQQISSHYNAEFITRNKLTQVWCGNCRGVVKTYINIHNTCLQVGKNSTLLREVLCICVSVKSLEMKHTLATLSKL